MEECGQHDTDLSPLIHAADTLHIPCLNIINKTTHFKEVFEEYYKFLNEQYLSQQSERGVDMVRV